MKKELRYNMIISYIEIMNQCFKDLDDFGKDDKEKYKMIVSNHKKYYNKVMRLLDNE